MSQRKFDRYMIGLGAARHVKFRRLTIPERYAFFMGVLSIAAQSPVRGCLTVGSLRVEPADVAGECGVPTKVAASALVKLRAIGIIYEDPELDCERVHDFDDWNPEPRVGPLDATASRRQALFRDAELRTLIRARDLDLCRYCGIEVKWNDRRGTAGGSYDHLDPNGPNAEWNLVVACRGCNSRKGSRTPEEAGMPLRPEPQPRTDLDRDLGPSTREEEEEREVEGEEKPAASPLRARAGEHGQSLAGSVACPDCAAPPGELCHAARGGRRNSFHLKRLHAVGEMTHITGRKPSAKQLAQPWAPSAEVAAMHHEHFPAEEMSAVASAAATLTFRRQAVTREAVHALLFGDEAA